MSYAVVYSRAKLGVDAPLVRIEVHLSNGLPSFTIVGMAQTAAQRAMEVVSSGEYKQSTNYSQGQLPLQ